MDHTWLNLEGVSGEEAKQKILDQRPDLSVEIVHLDDPVTMDLRFDRVRIFVDENQKVARAPQIG